MILDWHGVPRCIPCIRQRRETRKAASQHSARRIPTTIAPRKVARPPMSALRGGIGRAKRGAVASRTTAPMIGRP